MYVILVQKSNYDTLVTTGQKGIYLTKV